METIVPRSLILERARQAVESKQPPHLFNAWPVGTAAGQAFVREVQAQQALKRAAQRALEGVHA